jgi:hypothetical protein
MFGTIIFVCALSTVLLAADPPKKKPTETKTAEKKPAEKKPAEKSDAAKKDGTKSTAVKKEKKSARPENAMPLYRFYDHNRNEHLYTPNEDEVLAWRKIPHFKEHAIIGDVSPVEVPGTTQLWRAYRKDGQHYFYTKALGAAQVTVETEKFRVWVWKTAGDGRIPIYANTWTDATDVFLDPSLEACRNFKNGTKKALGVMRLPLGTKAYDSPAFFVYPHVDAKKPEGDAKDSKDAELKPDESKEKPPAEKKA